MVFGNSLSQRIGSNWWRTDGIRVEKFPGFPTLGILNEIQNMMAELKCEHEQFQGRIIFMFMFNDIFWRTPGNEENYVANSSECCDMCQKVSIGMLVTSGTWLWEKSGMELTSTSQVVNGTELLKSWLSISLSADIQYFRPPALWEQENWKSKGGGKKTLHYNGSEENVELILRTLVSVNQLSIYGAVEDYARNSRNQNVGEICESLVIPTEITDATSQSTSLAQGDLLQEYGRNFTELLDDQKLSKLCSDAGFLQEIGKGHIFITIEEGSEVMQTACWEYTQPRDLKTFRPRGWIRSSMKIGPVLDVKLYPHEGRYCIDIVIESLFKDQTVSWVRIVNGINKYVTETSEEISIENVQLSMSTGRLVAKAEPRLGPVVNLSTNYVPVNERIWIDINSKPFDHSRFAVSKFMIILPRHDASIFVQVMEG